MITGCKVVFWTHLGRGLDADGLKLNEIELNEKTRKPCKNEQNRARQNRMKQSFSLWQCGGHGFESRMLHHRPSPKMSNLRHFRAFFFSENMPCPLFVRYLSDSSGQAALFRLLQESEYTVHCLGYPCLRVLEHMGVHIQSRSGVTVA